MQRYANAYAELSNDTQDLKIYMYIYVEKPSSHIFKSVKDSWK